VEAPEQTVQVVVEAAHVLTSVQVEQAEQELSFFVTQTPLKEILVLV
jgi:hypothetical protein